MFKHTHTERHRPVLRTQNPWNAGKKSDEYQAESLLSKNSDKRSKLGFRFNLLQLISKKRWNSSFPTGSEASPTSLTCTFQIELGLPTMPSFSAIAAFSASSSWTVPKKLCTRWNLEHNLQMPPILADWKGHGLGGPNLFLLGLFFPPVSEIQNAEVQKIINGSFSKIRNT